MTQEQNQQPTDSEVSFFEHIRALRNVLFKIIGVILLASLLVHHYNQQVFDFLLRPLGDEVTDLQFLSPLDPLFFVLKLDFTLGFLVSLPIVSYLVWTFVSPAVTVRRRYVPYAVIISSTGLGLIGAGYVYIVVVPTILEYMSTISVPGTVLAFTANGYFGFLMGTTTLLVLIFQIPLVVVGLAAAGILDPRVITKNRSYIYTGIVVVTAILTPTTDVITLGFMAIPAIVVLEIGALVARVLVRRK